MRILEIIHLRAMGFPPAELSEQLERALELVSPGDAELTLYRRAGLDTDLSIHILRRDPGAPPSSSALGLRLAAELRAFGMVEHVLWEALPFHPEQESGDASPPRGPQAAPGDRS